MEDVRFAELISKIAHELRSPLTSIKGFSATLLKRWERFTDEQRFQFVESIHSDSERMGRIISEVLDLARLEAGRLELHPASVEVAPVAAKAVDNIAGLPGAARVEMDISDDVIVWADPERLERVLTHLVENAVKYSDDGPVRVSARRTDGEVELSVRDQGVGIEPERLDGIFTGPAATGGKAQPSGTGLGLYLTRRLVEAHGGTITVESDTGAGSTFTIHLAVEGVDV